MTPIPASQSPSPVDQARGRLRIQHYSIRTERQYVHGIKYFILLHGKRYAPKMKAAEVKALLAKLIFAVTYASPL